MVKKVLVVSTSLRGNSNSEILAKECERGAKDAGHEVEFVSLRGKDIRFCIGCMTCQKSGRCVLKDDVTEIMAKVKESEVIIFATPIYYYEMCGQMKTLIDRCCARYTEMTDKEFYFILTAAEESIPMMERTVECFRGFLDCLEGPVERGVVYGVGAWHVGEIESSPAMQGAYELGLRA